MLLIEKTKDNHNFVYCIHGDFAAADGIPVEYELSESVFGND